jgi:hypothetical protein
MRTVAAAPLLIDDPLLASPELALVDADLAAQLRAELASGEGFRPREVARPAYLTLVVDGTAPELTPPDELAPLELDAVDVIPAYIVLPDEEMDDLPLEDEIPGIAENFDLPVPPAPSSEVEELPDYIVQSGESTVARDISAEPSGDKAQSSSDYPVLPAPDERSDALEETEAALRRIREQMVVPGDKPASHVRRRLAIVTGLGLGMALAAVAVDVQLGVLHAPGWLGL